jgi:hypothetical protein
MLKNNFLVYERKERGRMLLKEVVFFRKTKF